MPSLRSYVMRSVIQRILRPKFARLGRSVTALRKVDDYLIKWQKVPAGTVVEPVDAGGTSAEWVRGPGVESGRVVLYLHGGGFVMGSPATHRELVALLSVAGDARMLALDYRLAPEHPFPAAVEDAVHAYRWLLEQGYKARQIAIGGDSAGGGLALQTLLALRDEGVELPAAGFFLSPVTDLVHFDGNSYVTRAKADPLIDLEGTTFFMSHYVGDNDPETPLLAPFRMDLAGLPPLCIHVGDREVLLSDSVRLAERARAVDVEVEIKIWSGMWHVFQGGARWLPEARRSIEEIGRFLKHHMI